MNKSVTYQAYYTKSEPILNYMADMLQVKPEDKVLEPCGGDGAFVDKLLERNPRTKINVLELNPEAACQLRKKYQGEDSVCIKETDTLLDDDILSGRSLYDKIIGNPPYGIRNDGNRKKELEKLYPGLYIKESYTLFLYACIRCLKENGKLSFIIPDTFLSLHRHIAIRKYLLTNTCIKELALFPSSFFPGVNFGYANLCIITLAKRSDISQNLNNSISIRTGFNSVDELTDADRGCLNKVTQGCIYSRVGSAFMFNSTERIATLVNDMSIMRIGDFADCVTGFYSGNDKEYLRSLNGISANAKKYKTVDVDNIHIGALTEDEKINGIEDNHCFIPIVKGGSIKYQKKNIWYMDWSSRAVAEYRKSKKCRFQNSGFYFRNGIGIPMVRSSRLTGALINCRLFDQSIVGVFPKDESWMTYLLAFFNSKVCSELINAINPSTNNSANYIKKIPFIMPDKSVKMEVEKYVVQILAAINSGVDISPIEMKLDKIIENLYYNKNGIYDCRATINTCRQLSLMDLLGS